MRRITELRIGPRSCCGLVRLPEPLHFQRGRAREDKCSHCKKPASVLVSTQGVVVFVNDRNYLLAQTVVNGSLMLLAGPGEGGTAVATPILLGGSIFGISEAHDASFFLGVGCAVYKLSKEGIISLYAGVPGVCKSAGDGGAPASATFRNPTLLATDASGDCLCLAEPHDSGWVNGVWATVARSAVRCVNATGSIYTLVEFSLPLQVTGLAFQPRGNLFLTSSIGPNQTMYRVDMLTGVLTTVDEKKR